MKIRNRKASLIAIPAITMMAVCGLFTTHCKKFEVTRQIIVRTGEVTGVTATSCSVSGTLLDLGESGVSQHGFCWSLSPDPARVIDCKGQGPANEKGVFSDEIFGLSPGTKYYIFAFAAAGDERVIGDPAEFTTVSATPPEVETGGIQNITSHSAQCEYNVVSDGGIPVIQRGLCWNTVSEPTIDGPHTTEGTGTGLYTGTMNELAPETFYHVRAFAINDAGVAYGLERTFTTLPEAQVPTVHTTAVEEVMATTAVVYGSISSDGGSMVTDKGFCWNTEPEPTVDHAFHVVGNGPAPFEYTIEGLAPNTPYFVRAFAVNGAGIGYGEQLEFLTRPEPLEDERDGKIYQTVRIGDQIWMAQNLDIGEMINGGTLATDNGLIEKYCFGDAPVNCELYGSLYLWREMMHYGATEMDKGICPDGWHIPSDEEWKTLERALGMSQADADATGFRGPGTGGLLKDPGISFWNDPNQGANNESGFSARGAGVFTSGGFVGIKEMTGFWTSSLQVPNAWYRGLSYISDEISRETADDGDAFSVRCVKD